MMINYRFDLEVKINLFTEDSSSNGQLVIGNITAMAIVSANLTILLVKLLAKFK